MNEADYRYYLSPSVILGAACHIIFPKVIQQITEET